MKFSDVIGQHEVKQRFLNMVAEQRIPHAMMLCGNGGYGTLAMALAMGSYLLGQRDEGTERSTEAMLAKFQHPDLHFVFPVIRPKGTPSERKITSDDFAREWCEQLAETPYFSFEQWLSRMNAENQQAIIFAAEGDAISHKLSLKSSQGGYKVCIIWLPERMHNTFANKILKLLEEPPTQTVFIMVSEQPELLLETIRSRVQRIDVKRIADDDMQQALVMKRGISPDMAAKLTRLSMGNWLKAAEQMESGNELQQFHDMFMLVMRQAYQRNTKGMKKWAEATATFGREKQRRMLTYFASQLRENFMANFALPELVYMTEEEEAFSQKFARFVNEANVVELLELVDNTMRAIGQNANPKMQFFDFALQLTVLIVRK